MFCKVNLIGRMANDFTQIKNGVKCSVAYNSTYKQEGSDEYETNFIDIVFFGKYAEMASQYLSKGYLVYIEGSLSITSYNDKQGITRKATSVLVSFFRVLTSKKSLIKSEQESYQGNPIKKCDKERMELENEFFFEDENEEIPFWKKV